MILVNQHEIISELKTDYRKALFLYIYLIGDYRQTKASQNIHVKDLHQELYQFQIGDLNAALDMYKKHRFSHPIIDQLEDNKKSDFRFVNYLLSCCYNSYASLRNLIPDSLTFTNPLLHLQTLLDCINYKHFVLHNKRNFSNRAEKNDSDFDLFVNTYGSVFNSNQWINSEDDDQLNWIISYIKSYKDRNIITATDKLMQARVAEFQDLHKNKPSLHLGLELKEKASGVMYFFDTLHMTTNPEIAENLNLKIRKAYSQRKYRNENEGRSSSNYMLRTEVKKKLKELAKAERLKLNETIELLIEEAHKKLKN